MRFFSQFACNTASPHKNLVEHSTNTLENPAVEGFSNAIMLRGIVRGKTPFGSLGLEVSREILIKVFPPSIRP